jgi:glycosyltransferase involved in cell wall biosynthesis
MKPLKICIFTETYYPVIGGGETQAKLLAEGLTANGHGAIILTRRSDKAFKKVEPVGPVTVYRLAPVGKGQLSKWGLVLSSIPALIKLSKQYDIIFVSGFRIVGITAVVASKLLRKKCILKADSQGEMSGDFFYNGLKKFGLSPSFLPFRIFLNLRNFIFRKADAFSAISDEIAAELVSSNVAPQLIHQIPNAVDTQRFFPVTSDQKAQLRRKLDLPPTAKIFIYTGRLVSYKGLPLLLEVWNELQRHHNHIKLLLLGSGGMDIHNCEAELRAYVATNGLEGSVSFIGNVQNVNEYLQASDIFVFPTENDAFPSSLIEAMACTLPVVTTPVGAIKTVITNGQNGILVKPGDYLELYQALDKLCSDTTLASRLGQAARETAQSNYSSEAVIEKYLSLFHNTATVSYSFAPSSEK